MGTTERREKLWRGQASHVASLLLLGVAVIGAALTAPAGRSRLDALGYLLLGVAVAVLAARRRAPVPVLVVTTGCLLAYELRGYPGFAAAVPVIVAVYATVLAGYRLPALLALVAVVGGGLVSDVLPAHGQPAQEALQLQSLLAGWLLAAGVMAEVSRQRRAYLEQVEQRAVEAERTREEVAAHRAAQERLRIARELHDSLTHNISIIKVQAGVAIHLARKRDEEVPQALLAIQEASADAMRELRATLEVLRRDGDQAPANGLDRVPELVERTRSAGLPATVTVTGEQRPLPSSVDRAAYRIIQEALTNVGRHAGPATATVLIGYAGEELTVQVDDDGRAGPGAEPVPGVGLIGMRERVTALGGSLRAGPRPNGGFSVRAEFPL